MRTGRLPVGQTGFRLLSRLFCFHRVCRPIVDPGFCGLGDLIPVVPDEIELAAFFEVGPGLHEMERDFLLLPVSHLIFIFLTRTESLPELSPQVLF